MIEPLFVGAYWKNRRMTLREYAVVTQQFLARLLEMHPLFREMVCWGDTESSGVALMPDLSNLEELILHRGGGKDAVFSHPTPDGGPSWQSDCKRGFTMNYSNDKPREEGKVQVMITAGVYSQALNNAVTIHFPIAHYPEFFEYGFVKRIISVVVDCWQPQMALVTSHAFREKMGGEGGPRTVGWLTWVTTPAMADAIPAGIEKERLGDGVLITTTREGLSAESPEQVSSALAIQHQLKTQGFLK